MTPFLQYLAKTILISGLLYSYYWCCLRNAPFHRYNRCYLLAVTVVSLVLPFMQLTVRGFPEGGGPAVYPMWMLHEITSGHWQETVSPAHHPAIWQIFLNGQNLGYAFYIGMMCIFLSAAVRSLRYIQKISCSYPEVRDVREPPLPSLEGLEGIRLYLTDEPGTPFSFLKKIFWNRQLDLTSPKSQQIFRHELYHVRQRHTADILYLEALRILFWCNPFFHLIRKEIKVTHEFLADRYAASGCDKYEYAELLVWQTIGHHHPPVANSFFNTHLKRRITMLTQLRSNPPGYLSRILILPLLFLLFCAFGIRLQQINAAAEPPPSKTLTVVIDAGHGGFDPGTMNNDIQEKDLVLAIAQKVKQFGAAYNVNVLLTRNEDIMAGGKTTKEEGLRYRTNFASEHQADLFVSVHINNAADTVRGMQVYLSAANAFFQRSSTLGSSMIEAMKKTFTTQRMLQREENIYVLSAAKMPAILIECGNLKNSEDLAFITREINQETVAKNILQGIINYEGSAATSSR